MLVFLYIMWFAILLLLHDIVEAKGKHWPGYRTWMRFIFLGQVAFVLLSLALAFFAVISHSDPGHASLLRTLVK